MFVGFIRTVIIFNYDISATSIAPSTAGECCQPSHSKAPSIKVLNIPRKEIPKPKANTVNERLIQIPQSLNK